MDIKKLIPNLKDDEEVIGAYRQFWFGWFWHWFFAFLIILVPFFFLYLMIKWGWIGTALLSIFLFFGILLFLRTFRIWRCSVFILTSQRIINVNQIGFFDRNVSQIIFQKINDISYRKQNIFQTILNYGSLSIQTTGAAEKFVLNNLRNPAQIQQSIYELQAKIEKGDIEKEFTETELLSVIREIRSKIGEPRWRQIVEGDWQLRQDFIDEVGKDDDKKAQAVEQFFSREI